MPQVSMSPTIAVAYHHQRNARFNGLSSARTSLALRIALGPAVT